MKVFQIPAFTDNYFYVLNSGEQWAVVDPGCHKPIVEFLEHHNIRRLDFIFNTHHHPDHVGGNSELKKKYGCRIFSSSYDKDRIPLVDEVLEAKDKVFLGSTQAEVIFCPGHTLGHIAYWFEQDKTLFCGDTLFAMGCGRLFEGSYEQMFRSLKTLAGLPGKTKVYCAHEYTQKNGQFALSVDPHNLKLQARMKNIDSLRAQGQPTIPFLLEEELETNPFVRACRGSFGALKGASSKSPIEVFQALRQKRNVF